jgi:copper chaperone CopZ
MKPRSFKPLYILAGIVLVAGSLTLISWDNKQDSNRNYQFRSDNDTTPPKKNNNQNRDRKVRDLDEALEELENVNIDIEMENAMKEVQNALKEIDGEKLSLHIQKAIKEVDMAKINEQIKLAMKSVDMNRISQEVNDAMKSIDMEKIGDQVKDALRSIDMDKINEQIKEAMKNVDGEKIQRDINESMAKINWKEMEKNMDKVKEEMKDLGPKIRKELDNAKVEIEKAKVELREYKGFVDGLDKDGLINKNEPYTLKHKDGELLINGKKASEQVISKYRSFLEKHKSFSIEKTDDDFDIDTDSGMHFD